MISSLIVLVITIFVFFVLFYIAKFIINNFGFKSHRLFDLREYFPQDEIHTLRQVFYLIILLLSFVVLLYTFVYYDKNFFVFCFVEILFFVYVSVKMEYNTFKRKLLFLTFIPYGSLSFLIIHSLHHTFPFLINGMYINLLDFIHIIACFYIIKIYYEKFKQYTSSNSLSFSILLLFSIVFVSFIFTIIFEHTDPIDSLNMVSNAFTSNGYTILGKSTVGKLNAIFLVWSGYILSGVGTATLASAILIRHFNHKLDEIKELIEKNNED